MTATDRGTDDASRGRGDLAGGRFPRLRLAAAVIIVVLSQGLLAVAQSAGGSPLVGAVAAPLLALCGLVLVFAAGRRL